MSNKEFDFFISHASEDKENFVRALSKRLVELGYKVWYDEFTLKLGDSLFEEISKGIKNSKYGLVVISPHFLKKEWTKKELNGLIAKEVFDKENIILPIWLDIRSEDIIGFSPLLLDKLSVIVKENEIDKVVEQILKLYDDDVFTMEDAKNKLYFLQNCDLYERKKYIIDTENRIKNLVHFQEAFYEWFYSNEVTDDSLDDKGDQKKLELLKIYNLPKNIMYNSEFHPRSEMNLMIRLTKKWINKKASLNEIAEMTFLIDHYHELDWPYILWGLPNDSLEDADVYDFLFYAPYLVAREKVTKEQIKTAESEVWSEYYSGKYH